MTQMKQHDATSPAVTSEEQGGIAHIQFNRPEALNAVNGEVCTGLQQAILDAEENNAVKAVLISGRGRAFCAGGDLNAIKQLCDMDAERLHARLTRDFGAVKQIYECTKPTVAAVHGAVVGGGIGIAAACDFVVAEAGTKFAFPFLDLGIIPDMCIMYVLTQRAGLQVARRLLLRGARIKADEASRLGLVDEISQPGELIADAMVLAEELAGKAGPAMSFAKHHLNQISQYTFEESMEKEILRQTLLWKTREVRVRCDAMLQALVEKKG